MFPALDLPALLKLVLTAFSVLFAAFLILRAAASRYFVVDGPFDSANSQMCSGGAGNAVDGGGTDPCAACAAPASKKCSRCKRVRYCSQACQSKHWKSHRLDCKEAMLLDGKTDTASFDNGLSRRRKSSGFSSISLVPARGTCTVLQEPKRILFPYEEFVKLFNWDNPGFRPCGLVNCGNSCFANVVLQCLASTRPLLAYLLERDHSRGCIRKRSEWCFLCELQTHVRRATESLQPFSPVNILHRLPNIGGNLGYGRQEDAHEFMRFAIDTMQSVCLDEFGGEKALEPSSQETTLIQYIFGGYLQSQVICTKCNAVSNRYENMMDLTVEIQGNAESLEECLDQFTMKEWLDGENMYKCDGCNDYVKARKQLTIHQAPNILTIALKRFQSGRFGKLNKTISFPENLDLTPYMSTSGNRGDINLYTLYAVVVHLDMLNASFFGHYVCYTKDYYGRWFRIDDSKVVNVDVEEVLAQGAYMLLYSRIGARQEPFIKPMKPAKKQPVLEIATDASESGPIVMPFFRDTGHDRNVSFESNATSGKESDDVDLGATAGVSFESNATTGKESDDVDLGAAAGVRLVSVDMYTDDSQISILRESDSSAHMPIGTLLVEPVVETSSTEGLVAELEELGESMDCEEPNLSPCESGPSSSPCIVTSSLPNSVTEACDRSDPVICMNQDPEQKCSAEEAFKLSKNNVVDVVDTSSTALVDTPLESSSQNSRQVGGACSPSVSGNGLKPLFSRGFLDTPKRKEPTCQADEFKINGYANGHIDQNLCNNGANLELLNGKVYGGKLDNTDQSCNNGFREPDISMPSVSCNGSSLESVTANGNRSGSSLESVAANGQGLGVSFAAAGFLNKSYKTSVENRVVKKDMKKTDACCKANGFTGLRSSNSKSVVPCMPPGFLNKPYTRPTKASRTVEPCVANGSGFIEQALVCQNGNKEYKSEASLVDSNGNRSDTVPGMRFEGSVTSSLKEHSD